MQATASARRHHLHRLTPGAVTAGATRRPGNSVRIVLMGAVGQEFLSVLSDREFSYRSIRMLASRRSAGKRLTFEGREYAVEEIREESFDGVDVALFPWWTTHRPGRAAGDTRCEPGVTMAHTKLGRCKGALIANPNCSTVMCSMAKPK